MAKVLAAFVAGVVLTVGSLIYSRTQELSRFRKVSQMEGSAEPVPAQISTSDKPTQEPLTGPEDVKPPNRKVQEVEAASNTRVPAQVPEPAVPKVARPDRFRNGGSEAAQDTRGGSGPHSAAEAAASVPAGDDGAWHALPSTNSVPAQAQQPSSVEATPERGRQRTVALQAGTSLSIRLEETVSTDRNRSGDMFRASLDSPLTVNGFVLAERGARVLGRIEKAKRTRLLGSGADLTLRLTEITMADGQRIAIETTPWEEKGAHSSIADTPKMAAGAALGAVVGALTGAAKGAGFVSDDAGARKSALTGAKKRSLVLSTGARLTFRIARPMTITERLGDR
jgi:hypothetical protein